MQGIWKQKARPPQLRGYHHPRSDLLERLGANLDRRLTFLCAPAGYGKTVLACQFAERAERRLHWCRIDPFDADVHRFYALLHAAVAEPLEAAPVSDDPWELAAHVLRLLEEGPPSLLVLDDYHHLDAVPEIDAFMHTLLAYLPRHCHLLLTSRTQTRLGLARLVIERDITVVTLRDLAFDADDVAALARCYGYEGDPDALVERTGGWPAAVVLLLELRYDALANEAGFELDAFLDAELLAALTAEERRALLRCALLRRVPAEGVAELELDAGMLARLARERQLLQEVDGAFEPNPLLRDALIARARRGDPEVWRSEALRAGRYLHAAGEWQGLELLLDVDPAAALAEIAEDLAEPGAGDPRSSAWRIGEAFWSRIPSEELNDNPPALMLRRADGLALGRPEEALLLYTRAGERVAGELRAAALAGELRCLHELGRFGEVIERSDAVLPELQALGDPHQFALASNYVARAHLSRSEFAAAERRFRTILETAHAEGDERLEAIARLGLGAHAEFVGDSREAVGHFEAALAYHERQRNAHAVAETLNNLASAWLSIGEVERAEDAIERALERIERLDVPASAGLFRCTAGDVALAAGAPQVARRHFQHAVDTAGGERFVRGYGWYGLARAHALAGEREAARDAVARLERRAPRGSLLAGFAALAAALAPEGDDDAARIETARGHLERAVKRFTALGVKREQARALALLVRLGGGGVQRHRRALERLEAQLPYPVTTADLALVEPSRPPRALLHVSTLGRWEVRVDGEAIDERAWRGRKSRELVFYLAAHPDGATREELIEALWPDPPVHPEQRFSEALSRARRAFGDRDAIVQRGNRYRLEGFELREDATTLLAMPRDASREEARAALDTVRGPYLPWADSGWALLRRRALEVRALDLLERLLEQADPVDPGDDLSAYAHLGLRFDDAHLASHGYLIRLYQARSRPVQARAQIRQCRAALAALDLPPAPEIEALLT